MEYLMGLLDQQRPMSFSGKRTATPYQGITAMDAAKFVAEATPIIGDAMAAKEIYDEIQKPEPNYGLVAVLAGASLIGLVPLIGDAAAAPIKKVARGLLDVVDRVEVDPNALGMSFGNIKLNPKADPTQTGWTFRDVEKPTLNKAENQRVSGLTSRVEEVPINQVYATQPTVNPDFSTTSSSSGELPFVVRKNGKMFVQDGHHRLTKLAEEGVQNAKVRFIDLDGADTSTPLLDYDPNFNSEVKGILDALSSPSLGNVRLRPQTGSDFQDYAEKVNPNNVRVKPEQRPNLLMGDMNGMLPKNSELISKQGDVSYYKGSDGNFYATSYNPDIQDQDVVGYISGGSNSTDLSVVKEMQGQGIGGELQYLYRKQNPYAETGGLTEAGEKSLEKTYERLVDEGLLSRAKPKKLPKPKNKAEKTAKEILELRAKGEAKYVTDEMMSMADPQYMFNNTPLNMSEGARKLRAEKLGYNKELFHGGQGGIKAMDADIAGGQDYDTGVWSTTDRYNANRYAGSPSENPTAGQSLSTDAFDRYDDKGAVYPLLGKTDNYAKTNFEGANWGDAPKYARMNFRKDGIPTRKKISDMTQDWASWASSPEAARAARTTDSSGLLIKDVVDIGTQFPHPDHIGLSPEVATTAVTFDPTTLRSQFARFDPEFKHLKNLTAAGLLTPSAILAMQEYKKQQELERGLLSY